MFVTHRTDGQKIVIDEKIVIVVSKSRGQIRVGIEAPRLMSISRGELYEPEVLARIESEARQGLRRKP